MRSHKTYGSAVVKNEASFDILTCHIFFVKLPLQGSAPTISIDNTAGCQLYLSKASLEASITTAKSSEVNVLVPASETDGDWVCYNSFIWLLNSNNHILK